MELRAFFGIVMNIDEVARNLSGILTSDSQDYQRRFLRILAGEFEWSVQKMDIVWVNCQNGCQPKSALSQMQSLHSAYETFQTLCPNTCGEVTFKSKSMGYVNCDFASDDFEFAFTGGKVCRVHTAIAEFLSPKVSQARRSDISCNVYTFDSDCSDLFDVLESLVSTLSFGQSLQLKNSQFLPLLRLSYELGNIELIYQLISLIDKDSLKVQQLLNLLQAQVAIGADEASDHILTLRDLVASNFYKIPQDDLNDLDFETVRLILSSCSLKLKDENSLYDFISFRAKKDKRFKSLFEFVCFKYLGYEYIQSFARDENVCDFINCNIWTRLCTRLSVNPEPATNPRSVEKPGTQFVCKKGKILDGIIANLTKKCGGNVHKMEVVSVTASSFSNSNWEEYLPEYVAYVDTHDFWSSEEEPDPWICYDFKDRRVAPTSYTLRSGDYPYGGCHLKSWVLEVSNGVGWEELDRRANNSDLNGKWKTHNFKIAKPPKQGYRFIRVRMTGRTHNQRHTMELCGFELFGTLWEAQL